MTNTWALSIFLLIAILIAGVLIYINKLRIRNFDKAFQAKNFSDARKISEKYWQKTSTFDALVRRLFLEFIKKNQPEIIITEIKGIFEYFPYMKFRDIEKNAERCGMDVSDGQLRQLYRIALVRFCADVLAGKVPSVEKVESYGVPAIRLDKPSHETYDSKTMQFILQDSYAPHFAFTVDHELISSSPMANIYTILNADRTFTLDMHVDLYPKNIFTDKFAFHHTFDLNDQVQTAIIRSIPRERMSAIMALNVSGFGRIGRLDDSLIAEMGNVCWKVVKNFHKYSANFQEMWLDVSTINLTLRYRPPIFWRQSASEIQLGRTVYTYRVFTLPYSPHIACHYSFDRAVFYKDLSQIYKVLKSNAREHYEIKFS